MKILITGANGFIGKNLISELKNNGFNELFLCTRETTDTELNEFTQKCDFVFHLAGVNRPKDKSEFYQGNYNFTTLLLELLKKNNNKAPILMSSSIQAELDNDYGKSKMLAENTVLEYSKENSIKAYIFRLPNVFGKWSRPNYNSAIATFCYNISRDIEIQVNNPNTELRLVYIDDVVKEFINVLTEKKIHEEVYCKIEKEYGKTLEEITNLLYSFKNSRDSLYLPDFQDEFTKKLYSTYLSFLPEEDFSYSLNSNVDNRGSFTEFIKTDDRGQVSVNVTKPGITKGNHWHHTKTEKFLVVYGEAIIKFRNIHSDKMIEYKVTGKNLEVVDIPPGYTHNITNIGTTDLITIMWANECFDKNNPDTFYMEV
ncbi:MAG: SDR family oxidoreductase [Tissierellales bacterium]|nr:SDR family oxidoreductase [Tissierellales bacterium]